MRLARPRSTPHIEGPFVVRVRVGARTVALRLTPDADAGGFVVDSPTIRGLNTQGDSLAGALANGCEAARALLTEPRRSRRV